MGFLSSVNAHVEFYLSFFSETLSTVFAGERFLFSVNSHVSFKGFILKGSYDAFLVFLLFVCYVAVCACIISAELLSSSLPQKDLFNLKEKADPG